MLNWPEGGGGRASCFWVGGEVVGLIGFAWISVALLDNSGSSFTRLDGLAGAESRSVSDALRLRVVLSEGGEVEVVVVMRDVDDCNPVRKIGGRNPLVPAYDLSHGFDSTHL